MTETHQCERYWRITAKKDDEVGEVHAWLLRANSAKQAVKRFHSLISGYSVYHTEETDYEETTNGFLVLP